MTPFVKALVRWAAGKRLTDRLPNARLIALSPRGTDRYTDRRVTNTWLLFLGIQKLGSPRIDVSHVLIIGLSQGRSRDKEE